MSIPDIRPNSQDTSAFYLAHIYQQSSTLSNGSQPFIPSSLSDPTEPFSPRTSSVWVNGLWLLSLVISLSCALLGTLIQQWARRYERVAYPRYSPHKQAHIRAFYMDGVEKWRIPRAVEVLPILLHISLFLFFAGLSVFLSDIHRTIFKAVTSWISLCVISYAGLSLFPVFHKESLYSTPLSVLFSFSLTGIRYLLFKKLPIVCDTTRRLLRREEISLDKFFSRSMTKTAEEYAFQMKPEIVPRLLSETFDALDEDVDYEKFFEGLPRLCDSITGENLKVKQYFIAPNKPKLSKALIGLMDRTLSTNLVEKFTKHRRMVIFTEAIDSTSLLDPSRILRRVLLGGWHELLECIKFGHSIRNWASASDKLTSFYAQCVATLTISIKEDRDKLWIQLATVDTSPLSRHLHHNEDHHSLLLVNAIYVVRMSVKTYSESEDTHRNDILDASQKTLRAAVCKLDIRQTLPKLQYEFCDLWNKLVTMAQADQRSHPGFVSLKMLKNIRKLYIALHDTEFNAIDDWELVLDNSDIYPKCTETGHHPSSESSFPDLQVGAPQTKPDSPTASDTITMPLPFTQRVVTSCPPLPPAQPPSPFAFPVPEPYVPPPNRPPSILVDETCKYRRHLANSSFCRKWERRVSASRAPP